MAMRPYTIWPLPTFIMLSQTHILVTPPILESTKLFSTRGPLPMAIMPLSSNKPSSFLPISSSEKPSQNILRKSALTHFPYYLLL